MSEYAAGRELDALIAAKVMGWRYEPRFPGDTTGYLITPAERIIYEEWPAFSADIAAAWQVVERMGQDQTPRSSDGAPRWLSFMGAWEDVALWQLAASDAALAICRMALELVEYDTRYRSE